MVRTSLPCREATYLYSYGCAGGMTYCGIAALSLLGKLSHQNLNSVHEQRFLQDALRWLVGRQTACLYDSHDEDDEEEGVHTVDPGAMPQLCHEQATLAYGSQGMSMAPPAPLQPASKPLQIPTEETLWAGFNGRCNKPADTCYSFWVGASLSVGRVLIFWQSSS